MIKHKEEEIQKAYLVLHNSCGIEARDKVKVTRKAKTYECGCDFIWDEAKNEFIGKTFEVYLDDGNNGFILRDEKGTNWNFPFFCLELVEKASVFPDPVYISFNCDAQFFKHGMVRIRDIDIPFYILESIYIKAESTLKKD